MSNIIIDRRSNSSKSSPGRDRLKRRIDDQIKKAIPDIIEGNSITDIGVGGKGIAVPIKGLNEPVLEHDPELGKRYRVYTGNDQFVPGDKIPKPEDGEGGGGGKKGEASPDGLGADDFYFELTRQEFLEYFFADLELPNLEERAKAESITHYEWQHAGHTRYGVPPRLNVIRSMSNSLGRRIALENVFKRRVEEIEALLEEVDEAENQEEFMALMERLQDAQKKRRTIPFIDEVDLRYDHFKKVPVPIDQAVMFCLMDVSGSMGKEEKDIAKRFYFFLYLFLEANYTNVDIVWIRHHVEAKRVSEDDFFNSRESGGTIVSSALALADSIKWNGDNLSIGGYPTRNWNIYFAQASDGDNFYSDYEQCVKLVNKIMKYTNYYAYVQIRAPYEENLWAQYRQFQEQYPKKFAMRHIESKKEIWKVFRTLFETTKKENSEKKKPLSSMT